MKNNSIAFRTHFKIQSLPGSLISSCAQMKKTLAFIFLLMTSISLQVFGQASLNFYGNSNYLSKGSVISTTTTNFTIEAWVKWDGTGGNQAIVYNGHAGNSGYGFYLINNGEIAVLIGGITFVNSGAYLTAGEWTHLAVTRNSSTLTLYKNGTSIATNTSSVNTPNGKFTIGANVDGGETFKGNIDEVQFWTEERSQSQIQSDMNILSLPQTNLLAYYNFNNGTPNADNTAITSVPDVSGNGNTLMLNNFMLTGNTSNFVNDTFKIHYVSAAATGTGVGNSWANAYTNLRTAIDASAPGDEVWVAAGTYQPATGQSFSMKEGVKIYGGFPDSGNPTFADRNYTTYITKLIGSNNRVIVNNNNGLTADAILDGFTIADGLKTGSSSPYGGGGSYGGGMYNANVSPTILNCIFSNNKVLSDGGGVYNENGSPVFTNCTFSANACSYSEVVTPNDLNYRGGGMANNNSTPTLTNCTFSGNRSFDAGLGGGGGIYNNRSNLVCSNCTFDGNNNGTKGGAVYNYSSSPVFTDCHFFNNSGVMGGAIFNGYSASAPSYPAFTNCVFVGNHANQGGVLFDDNGFGVGSFSDCLFYDNSANSSGAGSVVYATYGESIFAGCVLTNNTGPIVIYYEHPKTNIFNSVIYGNSDGIDGLMYGGGELHIYNSLVQSYPANNPAAGMYVYTGNNIPGTTDPLFVNAANPAGTDGAWGTVDDGFQLQPNSPLIGTGANNRVTTTTDFLGNPRIQNGPVDIGAYESNYYAVAGSVLYVDSNIADPGNGSSWNKAYKTLSDALGAAGQFSQVNSILIAKGTYYPTGTQNGTDRNATFLIPQRGGIEIYGGYPNGGGTRNIQDNPTILSGDIGIPDDKTDNSCHVMVMTGTLPDAGPVVVDGLTITGGNANSGTQYTYNGVLTNQTEGGGILFRLNDYIGENIIIRNSKITANSAITAGGLYLWKSSVLVHNTTISENSAVNNGGGIFIHETSSPRIVNSLIVNNTAANGGGIFSGSAATNLSVINSTIAGNTAGNNGDNLHNNNSSMLNLANSIVWGKNAAKNIYNESTINASYSDILKENGVYAGTGNINENPVFVNSQNYIPMPCSPVIDAGNNTDINNAPAGSNTYDVEGNPRILGDAVDMGAYELQPDAGHTNFTIETPPSVSQWVGTVFPELELSSGETGQVCYILNENVTQTITAPEGAIFSEVIFASYGNASGSCETGFTLGSCNASGTAGIIENLALGNNSFTISVNNTTFGDPCNGVVKKLFLTLAYTYYSYSWTNDNPAIGLPASGTGSIPSFEAAESGTANITLTATSARCAVSDPVTFAYTVVPAGPLHVDESVSASGDGTSWATAFKTLQEALNTISESYPSDSILVAKGTYMPDNNQSFSMIEGVKIIGGFPNGGGERDIAHNATILKNNASGSIVVRNYYNNLTPASVLDGFTITNVAGTGNMAMYNVNTSPTIRNCIFTGNQANYGGAMHNVNSSPVIINCIFSENIANLYGGAICNMQNSSPVLINCLFSNNRSQNGGGALYNHQSSVFIYNNTFYGNTAMVGSLLFNTASSNTEIINSMMWNNGTNSILNDDECSILYSNIEGGYTGEGNINQEPVFVNTTDPDGPDAIWGTEDDGLILQHNSPGLNAGNNDAYNDSGQNLETDSDLAGNPRLYGASVDMGAYEFQNAQGVTWTINNEWLNGVEPDAEKEVFIQGNLSVGADYGNFEAKALTVEPGGSITINTGNMVTVFGKIKNSNAGENQADSFIVKSGGNLIQTEDYTNNENEGKITVERESRNIVRLDYTMWSSPTENQQIQEFSPMTLPNRIYTYETNPGNQSTGGNYEEVEDAGADFSTGTGYLFRAPNDWNETHDNQEAPYSGKFAGKPFNGNLSVATFPGGFTSIGNPYPSNIDPERFLEDNPGIMSLFFWNNPDRAYDEETQTWSYTGTHYVTCSSLGFSNPEYEGKSIAVGQGFIIYSISNSAVFNNAMRTGTTESFFKGGSTERHRFWLNLANAGNQTYNQILIGYSTGATNGIDPKFDAAFFGYSGSAIYSLAGEQKLTNQARQIPFDSDDVVSLGFRAEEDGKFIISLPEMDGIFAEGQTIYLKDKELNILHKLNDSAYEFESFPGEFNNRFEIVYKQGGTMHTDDEWDSSIKIYQNRKDIIIESENETIKSIQLFGLDGRKIYDNESVDSKKYILKNIERGIYVIKAQMQKGKFITRKILVK